MTSAWPHFVPRLELDVELKALSQRLDEVVHRVLRHEPLISSMEIRLEELVDRCGGDAKVGRLASQAEMASLELRCGQLMSAEILNLTAEMEELGSRVASKEAVEDLQVQHVARLDTLSCDITALQTGLAQTCMDQQDFSSFAQNSFLLQKDHREDSEMLHGHVAVLEDQLAAAKKQLEASQRGLDDSQLQMQRLGQQLEQQQVLQKVQEKGLQSMRSDLVGLEHRAWEEFASKTSVTEVYSMASEAHTKLDFAMLDRASLRQRMEEEFDNVKKTLYRQQSTFQEMDLAVQGVSRQDQKLRDFHEILEVERSARKELAGKVQQQQEQLEKFHLKLKEDLQIEEELRSGLQQQVQDQVSKCQATADSLSTCSTRISLEQMEKSLALRQSLDELSMDHRQLKSQLLNADEVRATRGEDGAWQVSRRPA